MRRRGPIPRAAFGRAVLAAVALLVAATGAAAAAPRPVPVVVPDPDNLQYLSFWLAKALGYFHMAGVDVAPEAPDLPKNTLELIARTKAEVFVLPPPLVIELVASGFPLVVVANLLQNDPINVVARGAVVRERGLTTNGPIEGRLLSLKGLKVGVAPGPPPRLRALFAAYGMDADRDVQIVTIPGKLQNAAFADGRVDVLYAHTPFLETALVEQDGVLLVNQSAGEVPALARHQIHTMAVTRRLRDAEPDLVKALVMAVGQAEARVHEDPASCVDALLAEFPAMKRPNVELLVRLYAPAVPSGVAVSAEGLLRSAELFPASRTLPDLARVDLTSSFDSTFAAAVDAALRAPPPPGRRSTPPARRWPGALMAVAGAIVVPLVWAARSRRRSRAPAARPPS